MRVWVAALIVSLVAAAAARAADIGDPVWAQAPDRSDWAKAYPAAAAGAGVSGDVKLRCTAMAEGALSGCSVIAETPVAEGFGAAALALTSGMQLRPTTASGQSVAGRDLIVPVRFEPALLHPGAIVGNPDWLRRPTNDELVRYFPADADGLAGQASVDCVVTNRGLLAKCSLLSENPKGHGFGSSALVMTELFVMRPMTVDGLPVGGGQVIIPISFGAGAPQPGSPATGSLFASNTRIRVLSAAPWSAAPTAADMASAYPRGAIGKFPSAHVVLRCGLRRDGELSGCDTIGETPGGAGFASAARSLTRRFRVIVGPNDPLGNLYVDVPFDFRDPTGAAPPMEISDPLWLTVVDPDAVVKLFPPQAVKAGYREGRARLVCGVAHDGSLTGCSVSSDIPAGFGFGAAALQIAAVMKMNPWTQQGAPVDGARILLPIKLVLPPDQPPAAPVAPAAPPPKP